MRIVHRRSINIGKLLFTVVITALLWACNVRVEPNADSPRVLVVHTYGDMPDEYAHLVERCYAATMERKNMQYDVRHLYMGRPQNTEPIAQSLLHDSIQSLISRLWIPQLVIVHNDDALKSYLIETQQFRQLGNVPFVYAGVLMQDRLLRDSAYCKLQCTGFRDSLYVHENVQMLGDVWGTKGDCMIELDSTEMDVFVREQLDSAFSDTTRYIDNRYFRLTESESYAAIYDALETRPIILGMSLVHPEMNAPQDSSMSYDEKVRYGSNYIREVYRVAKYMHQLQAMYGVYSNTIIDQSRRPQLSMTNAQFLQQHPTRILGGYFALLQTQVDDVLGYAARILNGEPVRSLPVSLHKPDWYLDWNAMQIAGIHNNVIPPHVQVLNIPFSARSPQAYDLMRIGSILVGSIFFTLMAFAVFYLLFRQKQKIKQRQENVMEWLLGGKKSGMWRYQMGVLVLSPNLKRIFDTKVDVISLQDFLKLVHPQSVELVKRLSLFDDPEGFYSHRVCLRSVECEEYHWYEISYSLNSMSNTHSHVEGLITLIDADMQEEHRLQNALQNVEETRLKEAFLANMTHDIRSPLSTIVSFADMLATDGMQLPPEDRSVFVEQIGQSTRVMLTLLEDVVNVSRMQLGQYRFMSSPQLLSALVEQAYLANSVLVPSNLTLNKVAAPQDGKILVDPDRLIQVLNNFLSNAIKNTPDGHIEIGWTIQDNMAELYVEDTGVGISEERQSTIFEKFTKFDGQSGAGLGLNICKTIVEKLGGTIGVQSVLGEGSRFSAKFPLLQ